MKIAWTLAAGILVAAAALSPLARADDAYGKLIASEADSIVAVKYVIRMQMTREGQSQDSERSGTTLGVIVDPVGLIMVPSGALAPRFQFPGMEMTSVPLSIRVIFPGDPKEYDAVLGATDSRLGLSFIRMKSTEGRAIRALDWTRTAEPVVGMRAYGVSRLSQGFDFAPYCEPVELLGEVSKPRKMWMLGDGFRSESHPLYDATGAILGVVVDQEGVGERFGQPFLLPLKVAQSTIARAGKEAERVLAEALEREAEEGDAKPAEEEAPADEAAPPDDEGEEAGDGG